MYRDPFVLSLIVLGLLLTNTVTADDENYCPVLSQLSSQMNTEVFDDRYSYGDQYFCNAEGSPARWKCQCGWLMTCKKKMSPWGTNIGVCGCCSTWLIVVLCIYGVFLLGIIAAAVYFLFRGRWFLDGHPEPVKMLIPKRGPVLCAPANANVPNNLFRGYRSNMFVNGQMQRFRGGESEEVGEIARLNAGLTPTPSPTHQRSRSFVFMRTPQSRSKAPAASPSKNAPSDPSSPPRGFGKRISTTAPTPTADAVSPPAQSPSSRRTRGTSQQQQRQEESSGDRSNTTAASPFSGNRAPSGMRRLSDAEGNEVESPSANTSRRAPSSHGPQRGNNREL